MMGFFASLLFFIGLFYYPLIVTIRVYDFLDAQLKNSVGREANGLFLLIAVKILAISSWLLFWGRLPFPFFGFHR